MMVFFWYNMLRLKTLEVCYIFMDGVLRMKLVKLFFNLQFF